MKRIESPVPLERIQQGILLIRGKRVMLDADLAELYGVSTKRLNEQVKRNRDRFPEDFMFQLTAAEKTEVVAKCDHLARLKYSPTYPYAFTEHGAIMLAAVLSTPRAIEVSVFVVRAFVRLREILTRHRSLAGKLVELERRIETHDEAIQSLVSAIQQLMTAPERALKKIGFQLKERRPAYGKRWGGEKRKRCKFSTTSPMIGPLVGHISKNDRAAASGEFRNTDRSSSSRGKQGKYQSTFCGL
jgi:hypothetical protein